MFSDAFLGPAYSLATAVCWAVAVLLFKKSGESMTAVGLNYFKNVVALGLFALTLWALGSGFWTDASRRDVLILLVSGALGIGIADSLFFYGLNTLGAGRTAIVECLYSPLVVAFSVAMLGERLSVMHLVGGACILAGVLLSSAGAQAGGASGRHALRGVVAAAIAMGLMAFAIVLAKPVLERHDVIWSTSMRLLGGVLTLTVLLMVSKRRDQKAALASFLPQPGWRYALPGAVVGAYIALIFWIAGFKYTTATTASLLNQMSTLFIVLLAAIFLREPLTPVKALAVFLSFGGSVLVLL